MVHTHSNVARPLCALFFLLLLPAALSQAPVPNGIDSISLEPIDPAPALPFVPTALPPRGLRPTIPPNISVTPATPSPTGSKTPTDPKISVTPATPPPTESETPSESTTPEPELEDLDLRRAYYPNFVPHDGSLQEIHNSHHALEIQVHSPTTPLSRISRNPCKKLKCRNLDGSCTSSKNKEWGQVGIPQFSYLKRHTAIAPGGQGLQSARIISNLLSSQTGNTQNSHGLNELFVFFGQFLDHNLVATPAEGISWPIPNPDGPDMDFTRSTRAFTGDGPAFERPSNSLTSAIDLVAVYGNSEIRSDELLERVNGQLTGKMKTSPGDLLPVNGAGVYNAPDASSKFFAAGDHRVNEHPVLTALHTLFLREHNRLCEEIIGKIPYLSGKELYEFARKINIAQFQKIVYEEFYPAMIKKKLKRYRGFKRKVNPSVSDVFAGAAYRVGHTTVSDVLHRTGPSGALPSVATADVFFQPASAFSSPEVDNFLRGAAGNLAEEVDLKVVDALRQILFSGMPGQGNVFDLVALNIQRGRDHNLPSYNEIRTNICRMSKAGSFSQISSDKETMNRLAQAYNDVDEVEAWPGLMAEDKVAGSGVGKVMECVWRNEFSRLRDGDQFFYLIRKKMPNILRKRCRATVRALYKRNVKLFREIIVRNTGISASQLPVGNIFKA